MLSYFRLRVTNDTDGYSRMVTVCDTMSLVSYYSCVNTLKRKTVERDSVFTFADIRNINKTLN